MADPACQVVIKSRRAELKKEFKKMGVDGVEAGLELTTTLEKLMEDFFARNVTKDITLTPTPSVKGAVVPKVHSNLRSASSSLPLTSSPYLPW